MEVSGQLYDVMHEVTNTEEHDCSWEADSRLAAQNNTKFRYRVNKSPLLAPIMNQLNLVCILILSFKIRIVFIYN